MWYNRTVGDPAKTRPIRKMTTKEITRFRSHIWRRTLGCWPWLGARSSNSYGNFKLDGYVFKAHRIAYQLEYGRIPPGKLVCHLCDNPRCCNPNHLFTGTQRDNMRDRETKGRNAITKLTDDDVRAIRQLKKRNCPVSQRRLAKWFRVSPVTIQRILAGTRRNQFD